MSVIAPVAALATVMIGVVVAMSAGGDVRGRTREPGPMPGTTATPLAATPLPTAPLTEPAVSPSPTRFTDTGLTGERPVNVTRTVTGGLSSTGEFEAKVTLHSVRTTTDKLDDVGDPPANGVFVIMNVTIEAVSGALPVSSNEFTIQADDDSRYEPSLEVVDPDIRSTTLRAGEKMRGNIVFDVPDGTHTVVYEPAFADRPTEFTY